MSTVIDLTGNVVMVFKPTAKTGMEMVFGSKQGPEIGGDATPSSLTGTTKIKHMEALSMITTGKKKSK
jgi:hypothetical protein